MDAKGTGNGTTGTMTATNGKSTVFPAGVTGAVDLTDFDALSSVTPLWDQRHAQIGRGRVRMRGVMVHTSRMQLACFSRSPGVLVRGGAPKGATVIGVLLDGLRQHVQRVPWTPDRVGVVPRGAEFELLGTAPHSLMVMAVDHERLDEEAHNRWGHPFPTGASGPCLRLKDNNRRRALIATWARWMRLTRARPELLNDGTASTLMEEETLRAVLDSVEPQEQLPKSRARSELARRTEGFLRSAIDTKVTMREMQAALGVPLRTLYGSFLAEFGEPPLRYWRALRLDAARADLRAARDGSSVAEIAMKWGFEHLGRFSVNYRLTFGESPSKTFRRALRDSRRDEPQTERR